METSFSPIPTLEIQPETQVASGSGTVTMTKGMQTETKLLVPTAVPTAVEK
jgi:hypothetical protein